MADGRLVARGVSGAAEPGHCSTTPSRARKAKKTTCGRAGERERLSVGMASKSATAECVDRSEERALKPQVH